MNGFNMFKLKIWPYEKLIEIQNNEINTFDSCVLLVVIWMINDNNIFLTLFFTHTDLI